MATLKRVWRVTFLGGVAMAPVWVTLFLVLIAASASAEVQTVKGESEANKSAVATVNPAPAGPFEQTEIRRTKPAATNASGGGVTSPTSWEMGKVPAALGAVIVLIFMLRLMGKRVLPGAGAGKASRAMQLIARTAVGPKHQVMLIQVGRRLVMVGSAGGEMNRLCEITDADEVAELLAAAKGPSAASSFKALVGGAGKAYEKEPDETQEDPEPEAEQNAARTPELAGLMDRVRRMSEKFQGT